MNQEGTPVHNPLVKQTDELYFHLSKIKHMRRGGKRT